MGALRIEITDEDLIVSLEEAARRRGTSFEAWARDVLQKAAAVPDLKSERARAAASIAAMSPATSFDSVTTIRDDRNR